ncbi:hypothetical protein Plhal703r1_c02g0010381 [Plasmopara halstedii]
MFSPHEDREKIKNWIFRIENKVSVHDVWCRIAAGFLGSRGYVRLLPFETKARHAPIGSHHSRYCFVKRRPSVTSWCLEPNALCFVILESAPLTRGRIRA